MKSFSQFLDEAIDDDSFINSFQWSINNKAHTSSSAHYQHANHVCTVTFKTRDTSMDLNAFVNNVKIVVKGSEPKEHHQYNTFIVEFVNENTSYNKCLITERNYGTRVEFLVSFCDDIGYQRIA